MSRTLLLGPAGSGKTRRVLDAVRPLLAPVPGGGVGDGGGASRFPRFLVLVPTYSQAEHLKRRLLRHTGSAALLDRGIATFEQLAERRTGLRLAGLAPAAVRDALLAASFESAAEPAFAGVARFAGFRRAALRFLDEVKALEADPAADVVAAAADRLAAAAGALPGQRGDAVRALVRVLAAYESRRRAEGLLDHGDLLRELLRVLRDPRGAAAAPLELFAMDGFTDLTPVQESAVQLLAASAERALATVLADPDAPPGSPLRASDGLCERLAAAGFRAETMGPTRRLAGDLARVERRLAGLDVAPAAPDGSVRLLAGADPDDEADRVARTVLGWTTSGIARADVLVVVRHLASDTAERVLDALRAHGVPARRFGGEPLASVPWIRSALRVMRLVTGRGDAADLVEAVRHGDARGVDDADGDRLGELVRERGAATEDAVCALARDAGRGAPSALDWIERLRAMRPGPLPRPPAEVVAGLLGAATALLRCRPLEPFDDADEDLVARDAAAMRALRDLAADLVRALRAAGRSAVAPGDVVDALAEAAESARFQRRDVRDDAVHVVDAEEARQWEVRAVVVAGLRMGEFPGTPREDLFLTDEERAGVEKVAGLRLPRRLDEALRREHLLFYAAATRARERLVLTCPASDDAGNPVLRSPFLDHVAGVFPEDARRLDGADRSPGDVRPAPGETFHRRDLERTALAALTERFVPGTPSEVRPHTGYALLPHLVALPESVVPAAARWFHPAEPALREGGAARAAMARPRARSASSLADFVQCPFRHFARKGLGLDEARGDVDDGMDALLAGSIAHAVLERAGRAGVHDPAGVVAIFDEVFRLRAAPFRRDLRLEKTRSTLRSALATFAARGGLDSVAEGFAPAHFEWTFGLGDGPRVHVGSDAAPVAVSGAADRIDVDRRGNAIVLDYKWSEASRYSGIERKIEEGADLQLPLYAIAARRALGLRVVEVAYVTLRDDGRRWLPVAGDAPVMGRTRPAGWGEGDGEAGLARAEAHVVELDRRIRTGDCRTLPRDENLCGAACPFADLCRFDGEPGVRPAGEATP